MKKWQDDIKVMRMEKKNKLSDEDDMLLYIIIQKNLLLINSNL